MLLVFLFGRDHVLCDGEIWWEMIQALKRYLVRAIWRL